MYAAARHARSRAWMGVRQASKYALKHARQRIGSVSVEVQRGLRSAWSDVCSRCSRRAPSSSAVLINAQAELSAPGETFCCICMSDLDGAAVTLTACGHVFHTACLGTWIDVRGAAAVTCPMCRAPLDADAAPSSVGRAVSLQTSQQVPQLLDHSRVLAAARTRLANARQTRADGADTLVRAAGVVVARRRELEAAQLAYVSSSVTFARLRAAVDGPTSL
jgi:hypothetical protein